MKTGEVENGFGFRWGPPYIHFSSGPLSIVQSESFSFIIMIMVMMMILFRPFFLSDNKCITREQRVNLCLFMVATAAHLSVFLMLFIHSFTSQANAADGQHSIEKIGIRTVRSERADWTDSTGDSRRVTSSLPRPIERPFVWSAGCIKWTMEVTAERFSRLLAWANVDDSR